MLILIIVLKIGEKRYGENTTFSPRRIRKIHLKLRRRGGVGRKLTRFALAELRSALPESTKKVLAYGRDYQPSVTSPAKGKIGKIRGVSNQRSFEHSARPWSTTIGSRKYFVNANQLAAPCSEDIYEKSEDSAVLNQESRAAV